MTKPFSSRELVARIKANLRRAQMQAQQAQEERLAAGDVVMDVGTRRTCASPWSPTTRRIARSTPA